MAVPSELIKVMGWRLARGAESLSAWKRLFHLDKSERFAKGDEGFRQGEFPREVFLLGAGWVRLTWELQEGRAALLGLRYPGQFLDTCAHELRHPYFVTATALSACEIYR